MSFSQSLKGNPKVKSSYPKATHDQRPSAVASNGRAFEGRFTTQMGAAKMKRAAATAEIQKPALALSAGHVSIGNPFGPSVMVNANAAGGTMVPKRAGL
jgi:hypothetical protein